MQAGTSLATLLSPFQPEWERIRDPSPNGAFACASACLVFVPHQTLPQHYASNAAMSIYEALRKYHVRVPEHSVRVSHISAGTSSWSSAPVHRLCAGVDEAGCAALNFSVQALLRHGNLHARDVPQLQEGIAELIRRELYETAHDALEDLFTRLPQSHRGNDGLGAIRLLRSLCAHDWEAEEAEAMSMAADGTPEQAASAFCLLFLPGLKQVLATCKCCTCSVRHKVQ